MSRPSFTTITLNPAIDVSITTTETLKMHQVHQRRTSCKTPGGKGINVAKTLRLWGHSVQVTGLIAQEQYGLFQQLFQKSGIVDSFITIVGPNRNNLMITDGKGNEIKINDAGWDTIPFSIEELISTITLRIEANTTVALCGSLPPALPAEILPKLIQVLQDKGCIVAFDSSKKALQAGCDAHPDIIKPNRTELEDIMGAPLLGEDDILSALEHLTKKHRVVIVTLEGKDAYFASGTLVYKATPPTLKAVDTTAAGDTLLGAFLAHYIPLQKLSTEVISIAVAAGSAAVECPSSTQPSIERIEYLRNHVSVTQLH